MSANEEYLDNLLKSVTDNNASENKTNMTDEEIAAMFADITNTMHSTEQAENEEEQPEEGQISEEQLEEDQFVQELFAEMSEKAASEEEETMPIFESEPEFGFESEPESEPEPELVLETESEQEAEPEIEIELEPEPEPEPEEVLDDESIMDIDAMLKELNFGGLGEEQEEVTEPEPEAEPEFNFDTVYTDEVQDLSEDDINKMLEESAKGGYVTEDSFAVIDETETDNADVMEINDLLQKSDNNEAVDNDMLALLESLSATEADDQQAFGEFGESGEADGGMLPPELTVDSKEQNRKNKQAEKQAKLEQKKAAKEAKKAQKQAAKEAKQAQKEAKKDGGSEQADQPEKKEKVGFWENLFDKLTEEEDEKKENADSLDGIRDINDENNAILQELDKEDKKAASKKAKGKKGKPPKKGAGKDDGDEEEDGKGKGGKAKDKKKAKPPKSKKEKKPKPVEEITKPGKKIKLGSILVVFVFAGSVLVALVLVNTIFAPMLAKQNAKRAFEQKDYETCYQELTGHHLNAAEETMRQYAGVVLKMERRITVYDQYRSLHKELEALDSLMKAVQHYETLYQEALNCGAEREVEEIYNRILAILSEEYGLAENQAKAITQTGSDVEYTRYLTALIEGESITDIPQAGTGQGEEVSDLLPEEEEM